MSTYNLQLINNANQSQQGIIRAILPPDNIFKWLSVKAKSKLKLKKTPTCCYLEGGVVRFDEATSDEAIFEYLASISKDDTAKAIKLYFSAGEAYVGSIMTQTTSKPSEGKSRVVASRASVAGDAYKQLKDTARLEGMLLAVGMPDLHPGNRFPIGATFISQGRLYPSLIGGDIGCGMALHQLSIPVGDSSQPSNIAKRLVGLEGPYNFHDTTAQDEYLSQFNVRPDLPGGSQHKTAFDSLGTIGRGNHFAEFLKITEIKDEETAAQLGLDASRLLLLVHSGSRDVGQHVLDNFSKVEGKSLLEESEEAKTYLQEHDQAVHWAEANRALIAKRVLSALGQDRDEDSKRLLDVSHNCVEKRKRSSKLWDDSTDEEMDVWMHRKGAASTFDGPVVIPGSRGARSYLVMPEGDGILNAHSLAHGAGRAMPRTTAKAKFSKPFYANSLYTTVFGSEVVCENLNLLYEEAPEAYKNIDDVVQDLVDVGACRVVAVMLPVVTYKCRQN